MKKVLKGLLLVTIIISLVFTFTACGDGNGNGGAGNGGSAFIGETLTLSGQVWTEVYSHIYVNTTFEQFSDNRTLTNASFSVGDDEYNIGGSGSIASGQLSFTISTPYVTVNIGDYFDWGEYFNNFNISPSNARVAAIEGINLTNGILFKYWEEDTTWESVYYIYVDRDVTISGRGKTTTDECDCVEEDGQCYCYDCDCGRTTITRNINFSLKTGWNVINTRNEYNERNETYTTTISTGDSSSARWLLYEWGGYYSMNSMNLSGNTESLENVKANNKSTRKHNIFRSIKGSIK